MCPVSKPSSVVLHRFELQKTEREILEASAMAYGVGNILSGVGSLLTPFAGVLSAIAAAYIAKEGVGAILGWADKKLSEKENAIDDEYTAYLATRQASIDFSISQGMDMSGQKPPLTRAEYEELFGRANMSNWEKIKYDVAGEVPGTATSRSELDKKQAAACEMFSKMYGRKAAEDAGVCPIPPV